MLDSARAKLAEKNCDLIVANATNEEGAGFAVDTNRVTLVTANSERSLPLMSKRQCASGIVDAIEKLIGNDQQEELVEQRQG
jgi:phosphopantothenoylcysteine decarboxylase/phosphopantothenate--cysteine ligase